MTFQMLLAWQNMFFVCPMVLGLIFLGLSLLGGTGDHDVNVDHDVSVDLDHDVSVDHDVSADHDVSHTAGNLPHDFSHEIDHDSPSVLSTMLSALGIGKAPFSILMFCWLMIFGFTGLCLNALWTGIFGSITILVILSGAAALATSLTLTSLLARLLGKFIPQTENHSEKLSDFINREAEVRYTVTANSGTVTFYDKYNHLQTLIVRKDASCQEDIPPNTKVIILSYSEQDREFIVIPANQINK